MSHITCPTCGSSEHYAGYGFAAGGLGWYTICLGCNKVLEREPDTLDEFEPLAQPNEKPPPDSSSGR